jgi:hypothetical protein
MLLDERLYSIITLLEKFALDSNAILWGSYVTSKILHSYYSDIYYSLDLPIEKFWDPLFHLETIDRTFRCTEISISFPENSNFRKFNKKCLEHNITINIEYDDDGDAINMTIEEYPEININILMRTHDILPPFGAILFLCDGFIMRKVNNTTVIEYSRNTGTKIDNFDSKKFKIAENNIIKDIYKKKTVISNIDAGYLFEIYMLIDKGWTISNLPYSVFSTNFDITDTELIKYNDKCCVICLNRCFNDNKATEDIAIIYRNINHPLSVYYPIHHSCLTQYILHKNSTKFMCPFKYIIDFSNCDKLFNYEYYLVNGNKQISVM